jgi:hypothetical protein
VDTPQVSLDSSNKLFLTNFKLTSAPDDTTLRYDLTLSVGGSMQAPSVGLLHCNNMRSGSSYHMVIDALRRFYNEFYAGMVGWVGGVLLRAEQLLRTRIALCRTVHPSVLTLCLFRYLQFSNSTRYVSSTGPDGPYLLQALRLKATGHTAAARAVLQHPVVLRNCTTFGGPNIARHVLLYHWAQDGQEQNES